jgi:predicted transcriptional regulator
VEALLGLSASSGYTTYQLAELLTAELHRRNVEDSISQATVSRYLKTIREERKEATREHVREFIKETLPKNLEVMDEILRGHLDQYRNENLSFADRSAAGMRCVKIIETKLKYAGILEDGSEDGDGADDLAGKLALSDEDRKLLKSVASQRIQDLIEGQNSDDA